MDMNHFIGQRFNLISKSDIRYVGTLHEINPEDSTIALENVVSHGTEGRRGNPAEEIAPSSSVYEYIVFRGSDVKDISVAEEQKENQQPEPPQVPNDPAILGSGTRPGPPQGPPRGQSNQYPPPPAPRQPPPGYPQQPPFPGYYPPYGQRFGPPGFPPGPFPNAPYGAPQGWYPPPGQGFQQPPNQFPPPPMPIGPPQPQLGQQQQQQRPGGPPANVPQSTSELPVGDKVASKPTTPAPAGPAPSEQKPSLPETTMSQKPAAPPAPAQSLPSVAASSAPRAPPAGPKAGRVVPAIPISKPPVPAAASGPVGATAGSVAQQAAQNARATSVAMQDATRAATAAVAAAMAKLPQPPAQGSQQADSTAESVTKKVGDMKTHEGERAPRPHQNVRGGRGGHRGGHYQPQVKKVEVPTDDYDFQSANAKFNKQDLVKEAIATGSPLGESEPNVANGTLPTDGAEGTNGSASHGAPIAYNKASSFFDNISSESRDREEGARGKTSGREWRGEEEKKNMETFGQGSVDGGYRGGYRGRGRGRGYGGPRGRGTYARGYAGGRGRGGFRGGRGAPQATGVPSP